MLITHTHPPTHTHTQAISYSLKPKYFTAENFSQKKNSPNQAILALHKYKNFTRVVKVAIGSM